MADEKEYAEKAVDDVGIPQFQKGLVSAINETFSYANNSLFYALVPAYLRDYMWRYIRVAIQWLDGYVWALHQAGASGIISTRLASKLITGLTKQVVGEKLLFRLNDKSEDGLEALKFITKWSEEVNLIKAIYSGVGFSLGIGTALLKKNVGVDKDGKQKLWVEGCRLDKCYYLASFQNEPYDATFVIRSYPDTRQGHSNSQFFLIEHRYYKTYTKPDMIKKMDGSYEVIHAKGDKVPMVEYKVSYVRGTSLNPIAPTEKVTSVPWAELPQFMRDFLKKDYSVIKVDISQELPFNDLGVYPLLNGNIDLSVPTGANFGESMIVGIQDDLITYELASSYLIRDMYLGKGTVYLPKSLSMGDVTNPNGIVNQSSNLEGVGEAKVELMKGVDPEQQKAIVQQFEMRGEQHQQIKENCLKNISVKWGMSPKILAAFLTNGQAAMTATQIDSEDDSCIAFINHTRAYFKNTLNKMIEDVLNFYGYKANVSIDFASPSLINKDRILERVIKERDNGLITTADAIRELYPDLDEDSIKKKIEDAETLEKQKIDEQLNEMNDDGSFGNEEDNTSFEAQNQPPSIDDTLKGSSVPIN